jgi:recombinational DNA repair ATPase RecF
MSLADGLPTLITKINIHGYRKFKDFTLKPSKTLNLVVGANEAGKSTLLEAIALGLTGRINGRTASEDLNPYWFNAELVAEFVKNRRDGGRAPLSLRWYSTATLRFALNSPFRRTELLADDVPDE